MDLIRAEESLQAAGLCFENRLYYGAEGIGHRKAEQMLRWAKEFVKTVEEVIGHGTAR